MKRILASAFLGWLLFWGVLFLLPLIGIAWVLEKVAKLTHKQFNAQRFIEEVAGEIDVVCD